MHQVPEDGLEESANGSVATGQRAYTFERYGHHVGLDKTCLLMEDRWKWWKSPTTVLCSTLEVMFFGFTYIRHAARVARGSDTDYAKFGGYGKKLGELGKETRSCIRMVSEPRLV
jgi:hypothetical protein